MSRSMRFLAGGVGLLLLPILAHAEVSVQLDRQGNFKRVVYLTHGSGSREVTWGQVRARVPLEQQLNPLGDTYGDLAPTLATHPVTGFPWVAWPRNEGNQKRIVISSWDGTRWTVPVSIAMPDPLGSDQIEPRLLFDPTGLPLLVFTEAAPQARILFSTLARGVWTPPLQLSPKSIDSRHSVVTLSGATLVVTFATPTGQVTRQVPTTVLVESATNLMDSPIPPGATSTPGGDPGADPVDPILIHR
jgi:hypothetical protein